MSKLSYAYDDILPTFADKIINVDLKKSQRRKDNENSSMLLRCLLYVGIVELLQSGRILLQSGTGITKWDDYCKVGSNIG